MTDEHDLPTLPPSLPTPPVPPPPTLPDPASTNPTIPPPPAAPVAEAAAVETGVDQADEALAAAIRNVPVARSTKNDFGLPTRETTDAAPFVPPDIEPMRFADVAFVVGRCLFVAAALLVTFATRRYAAADVDVDQFWAVVLAAGVFVAVGLAGQALWAASLADNARRLRVRGVSARGQAIVWAAVGAWVLVACLIVLRLDLGGDFDPLPGVALGVWVITVLIAYSRLKAVMVGLSRTPPPVLLTLLPIDLVAFGVVWWRLLDLSTTRSDLDRTATIALVAAGLLAVAAALAAWFVARGNVSIDERLRRLEMQHRQTVEGAGPSEEWLRRRAHSPESPGESA